MVPSVARWVKAQGMAGKTEFVTPWGICDFVGLRFDPEKVRLRVQQNQLRAISSIPRACILLEIPDAETGDSTTVDRLARKFAPLFSEESVHKEINRLIADRFVISCSRRRLQKRNGWMPLHDRIVAIEMKLFKVEEAMHQAANNLGFADESYVALPANVAGRVTSVPARWSKFFELGIGLLGVTHRRCEVVRSAQKTRNWVDDAVQLYSVDKFWKRGLRGS